jgi:hypothetical protein
LEDHEDLRQRDRMFQNAVRIGEDGRFESVAAASWRLQKNIPVPSFR